MIKGMVESATAATRIEKGDTENGSKTLGEIQLLAAKAAQRISAINRYLKQRDIDLGNKVAALVNANPDLLEDVVLHKKSPSGRFFPRTVKSKELVSRSGYRCRVTQKAQEDADALESIQKLQIVAAQFPLNAPLQKIKKEKMLDYLDDLTPEQKEEVMNFDDQMAAMASQMSQARPGGPGASPSPRPTVASVLGQPQPTAA